MLLRRQLPIVILSFVVVGAPRPALAQWWEFIGEMSGPVLVGVGYNCKPWGPRPLGRSESTVPEEDARPAQARALLGVVVGTDQCFRNDKKQRVLRPTRAHYWLRTEAVLFYSIAHEANPGNRPRVWAVAPGLMLEASPTDPFQPGRTVPFLGVGFQVFRFFGQNFNPSRDMRSRSDPWESGSIVSGGV